MRDRWRLIETKSRVEDLVLLLDQSIRPFGLAPKLFAKRMIESIDLLAQTSIDIFQLLKPCAGGE